MKKICPLMSDKYTTVPCEKQNCSWWNDIQECCCIAEKSSLAYTTTDAYSQKELNSILVNLEGVPQ